jgi:hypothetical protein
MRSSRLATISCLLALGCGAGGGSTTPIAPDAALDANDAADGSTLDAPEDSAPLGWCKAQELRATRCATPFDPGEACEKATCFDGSLKAADSAALTGCVVTSPCDQSEDACFAPIVAKYSVDPIAKEFHDACAVKDATCGTSFTGDYCGYEMAMFLPTFFSRMRACVDGPCGEVTNCIDAVARDTGCR